MVEISESISNLSIGQHKVACPACQGIRSKHKTDKPLSVKVDNKGVQFR